MVAWRISRLSKSAAEERKARRRKVPDGLIQGIGVPFLAESSPEGVRRRRWGDGEHQHQQCDPANHNRTPETLGQSATCGCRKLLNHSIIAHTSHPVHR